MFVAIAWMIFIFFLLRVVVLLRILFQYTLGIRLWSKRHKLRKAGEWAVVTGASDGIGLAFAHELAADGLNVMLISRTKTKLDAAATVLQETYGVQTKCVVVDFTQDDIYEEIKIELDQLPSIACLVNNVGIVNLNPQEYAFGEDMKLSNVNKFIACNDLSYAAMTYLILPRLVKQNSCASLINVSSYSALRPLPFISLYSATKSFVFTLSQSLMYELNDKNVTVLTLYPVYVSTAMVAKRSGLFVISPELFARSALDMLGVESVTAGTFLHALQIFWFSMLPQYFLNCSMQAKLERAYARLSKKRSVQNDVSLS